MILGERLVKQLGFLQDPKWGGGILQYIGGGPWIHPIAIRRAGGWPRAPPYRQTLCKCV